jgi:hypothetical protein
MQGVLKETCISSLLCFVNHKLVIAKEVHYLTQGGFLVVSDELVHHGDLDIVYPRILNVVDPKGDTVAGSGKSLLRVTVAGKQHS